MAGGVVLYQDVNTTGYMGTESGGGWVNLISSGNTIASYKDTGEFGIGNTLDILLEYHVSLDSFTHPFIGDTDDTCTDDGRMLLQDRFDFACGNAVSLVFDGVDGPIDKIEVFEEAFDKRQEVILGVS